MKYDIKKAMREHPEECKLLIIEAMTHAHMWGFGHDAAADRIRETCRVQTVEEADRELAKYFLALYACGLAATEQERALIEACREARAREAAEDGK